MAERRGHQRSVQFEHAFDRLLAVKLEQVYGILVPEWVRAIGVDQSVRGKRDEGCPGDGEPGLSSGAKCEALGASSHNRMRDGLALCRCRDTASARSGAGRYSIPIAGTTVPRSSPIRF